MVDDACGFNARNCALGNTPQFILTKGRATGVIVNRHDAALVFDQPKVHLAASEAARIIVNLVLHNYSTESSTPVRGAGSHTLGVFEPGENPGKLFGGIERRQPKLASAKVPQRVFTQSTVDKTEFFAYVIVGCEDGDEAATPLPVIDVTVL